jgi:AcrR family transcriptional regulator
MPRINSEYREDAKKKILDAALAVATENGWKTVTLDDIAQRVGVTKGALYAYFENREALFRELIIEVFTRFRKDILDALADDPDIPVMLERLADLIFVSQKQYASLFVQMTTNLSSDPVLREQFIGIYGRNSAIIQEQISCMQADGRLPQKGDPEEIARAIVALAIGLRVTSIYLGKDAMQVRRIWLDTVRLMLSLPPESG